jgi:ABC-type antimicrobial peptide transport system permease subunit
MSTLEQHVEGTMGQPRFRAMLLSFFALAALFLAAVGIYGVVTTAAVQRTKEIGIRVAVGADAAQIVATILAHGLQPVAVGIAIGIAGALFFARLLSSVLYAVKPDDSATFAWAVLLLAAIATIACLAPALRAARLDPLEALRED